MMQYKATKKLIIFTGAGISAESGIRTFRDTDGLWEDHCIEEVCSQSSWKKHFETVHTFYNQRRAELGKVVPNRAHEIVSELKMQYGDDCVVITQNVDDLFERAGCHNVLHLHGELCKMECTACGTIWDIGYKIFDIVSDRCPHCGSLKGVKPHIVFFGGVAPNYREMHKVFESARHPETIVVIIGTMGSVISIETLLLKKLCKKILNNLEPSPYIDEALFDQVYYEKATTALEKVRKDIERYWKQGK